MSNPISPTQREALLQILQERFEQTMPYHKELIWRTVKEALDNAPQRIETLLAMENTGGEPNVVNDPEHPSRIVFMDCATESPAGRRSLCYDQEALLTRKNAPPKDSAVHLAAAMGIELLSETQYRALQNVGDFDLKTSSWVQTPASIRNLGGALFCDKRYGQVFVYHNGVDSYYGSRGFRGYFCL